MEKISIKWASLQKNLRDDHNLKSFRHTVRQAGKALPGASKRYAIQKVPVVQWLPNYAPEWLVNDIIAGVTVGILLIPQALVFAALAGIPLQDGLLASWLPALIYFFMGTSKDLSTGPTSVIGILTGQVVRLLTQGQPGRGAAPQGVSPQAQGVMATTTGVLARATGTMTSGMAFPTADPSLGAVGAAFPAIAMPMGHRGPPPPPAIIAATLAISIGIISLVFGALNLGWLLDFVSVPVMIGFFTGIALIIVQGQVPNILGEVGVSNNFMQQGKDIVTKIGASQPMTIAIGLSGIVLLVLLQLVGKKWGKKQRVLRTLANSRNVIVLVLFTGISFAVNKDLPKPKFDITGEVPTGLQSPKLPSASLLVSLIVLSVPIFLASALEHVLIAKTFGRQNNYQVDQSQELVFIGVANIVNGIFGGMPVGGSLTASSINSESGVKSPLGGLFTSGIVLTSIYAITEAIFWIPKATLAAIIIVAVFNILPPQSIMLKYWKTSFIDFVASFITMNITLMVSAETGIGLGVAFMVLVTLIRMAFSHATPVTRSHLVKKYSEGPGNEPNFIPPGTQVMTFNQAIIFMNAYRMKRDIMDAVQTYQSGISPAEQTAERSWSDLGEKRIANMRRKSNLSTPTRYIPQIRVLVLDLTQVTFIDTTGLQMLEEVKAELLAYGGEDVELRFVGLNAKLKSKFKRSGWALATAEESMKGLAEGWDGMWELLKPAIEASRTVRDSGLDFGFDKPLFSDVGSMKEDLEKGKNGIIISTVSIKGGVASKD